MLVNEGNFLNYTIRAEQLKTKIKINKQIQKIETEMKRKKIIPTKTEFHVECVYLYALNKTSTQ